MTNRFKGLDLIDRMPKELCTEVSSIVQGVVIRTIPKKKKCQKAKWLSEEALQIRMKRTEAKGKGEKERYTHLNAEFQRISKKSEVAQSCPTLCDPMIRSMPGLPVHHQLPEFTQTHIH